MKHERKDGKVIRMVKFRDRSDVHVVIALHTRKIRRNDRRRTVCGKVIDDMIRMAPHSDPRKEPATTCDRCVDAMVAITDIADRPVRTWPERKKK